MSESKRVPGRRDARENRERILDTAEVYFARHGLDAPLQGLTAAAKVGAGTLYRNFGSHAAIVEALYDRYVELFDDMAERALQQETGWKGIELVLDECIEILLDRGIVAEVMRRQAINDPDYRPSERWVGPLATLVERTIAEGSARPDLTAADLSAAPMMVGIAQTFAPAHRQWIAARMRAIVLDGLRAHPHEPTPLPEMPEHFYESGGSIMRRS